MVNPNLTAKVAAYITSPAFSETTWAPTIRPEASSATSLNTPRVSRLAKARVTASNGRTADFTAIPFF